MKITLEQAEELFVLRHSFHAKFYAPFLRISLKFQRQDERRDDKILELYVFLTTPPMKKMSCKKVCQVLHSSHPINFPSTKNATEPLKSNFVVWMFHFGQKLKFFPITNCILGTSNVLFWFCQFCWMFTFGMGGFFWFNANNKFCGRKLSKSLKALD